MLTLLLATQHCTGPSLDMRLDQGLWGGLEGLAREWTRVGGACNGVDQGVGGACQGVDQGRRRSSPGATWTLPAAPRAAADSPPVRAPAGKAGFSELGPLSGEDPLISAVAAESWLQKTPGSGRGLLATRACKI
ncbi:Filamin-A-Interacting Protein 1 [Manis pentadactyla]|nr:Filamin-A-Interacting Protein 1 [Manis pentadactyla]